MRCGPAVGVEERDGEQYDAGQAEDREEPARHDKEREVPHKTMNILKYKSLTRC